MAVLCTCKWEFVVIDPALKPIIMHAETNENCQFHLIEDFKAQLEGDFR